MKLVSVNVGLPREVAWRGRTVLTSIWKQPVPGRVAARRLNLEGDRQADLEIHGGTYKAIYGYPSEHYPFWRSEYPQNPLPWGAFGENLTTEGLLESELCIGDRLRIGTVEMQVTQPRMPCYKLGIRFAHDDVLRRFLESGYSGFYFSVSREGDLAEGDAIEIVSRDPARVRVADITSLYSTDTRNERLLERAVALESLPQDWRDFFRKRLYRDAG
jgi:MOSC domain-containing protein YiiM